MMALVTPTIILGSGQSGEAPSHLLEREAVDVEAGPADLSRPRNGA